MSCCEAIIQAATQTTPCECLAMGYCVRHKCNKAAHFHKLCKTNIGYFEQYERGEGPGQNLPPQLFTLGLGDIIEWALLKLACGDEKRLVAIGIRADRFIEWISRGKFKAANDGTCGCPQRKAWLNRVFPLWPIRWPLWRNR